MTLKHLEALYWVWRLGSFTAAAERLHSTQSAISMRIRDLEEALGQELFDRTARAARLTTKGQELVGYAERVMELMAEIKARIGDPTIVSGIVRIGVTEYVALTWLPDLVRELNARFPRVTLEMNVDLTLSLLDKLRGGEIDLAMLPGPIVQPGLRNISLGFVEFAWMASPALKIPDRRLTPRDLDNWPILTLSKTSNLYAQLERWFEESGAVGRRTDTCNSLSVLASWTISGLGIGYLPIEHFGRDIRAGPAPHGGRDAEAPRPRVRRGARPPPPAAPRPVGCGTRSDRQHFRTPDAAARDPERKCAGGGCRAAKARGENSRALKRDDPAS